MAIFSSGVWATWMDPGPRRKGSPQAVSDGMSLVNLAIMVGRSPTGRMLTKGRSREKRTSARPATVATICWRVSSEGPTRRMRRWASALSAITLGARPPLMRPMLRVEWPSGPSEGSKGRGMARRSWRASMSLSMAESPSSG